ncbi:MAG: DNA internalization-related competence protein ComEC/Rec2, partial [Eggerthellaceae bacterium]|nr:DNA internalization-related competence protein ComEC/Rec2 [Eggerthellaceae bacterium]
LCLLLGVFLGGFCGSGGAYAYGLRVSSLDGVSGELVLHVVEDTRVSSWSSSCICRLISVDGEKLLPAPKVLVDMGDESVFYGQEIIGIGTLSAPKVGSSYYRSQAIVAVSRLGDDVGPQFSGITAPVCILREQTVLAVSAASGGDDSAEAVLQALICGYRTKLSGSAIYEDFKLAGVGHLVAVSGAHLSVMFALISLGLRGTRLSRKARAALQVVALLLYLCFAAIPLSALRAAVMVGLGLASYFSERRASVLNALGFCIIAVIALNPANALSASFLLSASSTLGIVLFAALANYWVSQLLPFIPRAVADALALTIAATMLSLPFGIALFGQCSLVCLPANLVSAPLFTLACTVGLGAAAIHAALPGVGLVVMKVALAICGVLCEAVRLLAHIPYACVPATISVVAAGAIAIALGLGLWLLWPKPNTGTIAALTGLCALSFVICAIMLHGSCRIVMLDVGQGDAILLQSGGRSILIDTGNQDKLLKEALARSHIVHLDAVLITHPDADHCASLASLAGVCRIDGVYVSTGLLEGHCANCVGFRAMCEELGLDLHGLDVGSTLSFGTFALRVIWPEAYIACGENEDSLCVLLAQDEGGDGTPDWQMLFTGDVGALQLQQMIDGGAVGDIDALKVSHHGSATGLDSATVSALSPELALISVGAHNRYGHPADSVLELLQGEGAHVLRTDRDGDISLIFTSKGVRVQTQR